VATLREGEFVLSKLNVNVGDDFPLEGDVASNCAEFSREMWREWKREQHDMRHRWRKEWHERFHAFRERMKNQKKEQNDA
jgi:hypothetical protein